MNVVFFGFGKSYLFYEKLLSKTNFFKKITFICQTSTYKKYYDQINPSYNNIYIDKIKIKESDCLNINSSLIDSDKKRFVNKSGIFKEKYYGSVYVYLKNKLKIINPDLIFFSQSVESPESLIIYKISKELNLKSIFPHWFRFLGGSYFSYSPYEGEENFNLSKSTKLKDGINLNHNGLPYFFDLPERLYPKFTFFKSIKNFLKLILSGSNNLSIKIFYVRLENILRLKYYYKLKIFCQNIFLKKKYLNKIPDNDFIFFPLQYTPESSINISSPYYIDQIRLIDEIRYNLKEGNLLLIKEHPSMIGRRNYKFYKQILNKSYVRIINPKIKTLDIIKKSKCVVSISGSASLEAFLFGIPSISISKTFFSKFLLNNIENLRRDEFEIPQTNYINRVINTFYTNSKNFHLFATDYWKIVDDKNIDEVLISLKHKLLNKL